MIRSSIKSGISVGNAIQTKKPTQNLPSIDHRKRLQFLAFSPFFVSNATAKWVLPSKDGAKNHHHHIQPQNQQQFFPPNLDLSLTLFPFVAHFQESFRIVGNHPVKLVLDAPPHHVVLINCPAYHGPTQLFCILHGSCPERPNENLLKYIEGNVWNREELTGVREGEANMSDGERR